MSWGDGFKSAWNGATDAARSAASAVATGAKAVGHGTAAAAQFMAREAQNMASTAAQAAVSAGRSIAAAAVAVERKAVDAAKWAADKTEKAAVAVADAGTAAAKATAKGAATAFAAAKQAFSATAAGVATACAATEDWIVGGIALGAGAVFTKPGISKVVRYLATRGDEDPKHQKQYDGDVLGAGCQKGNPQGVMPPSPPCFQKPGTLKNKITYVNGIDTTYASENGKVSFKDPGICKTMQEIARTTCSEVTGVYNATEGIGKDLDECLDNIAKDSSAPAVDPLRDMMVQAAKAHPPQRITIFAHSQGGLITQEAVAQTKQKLIDGGFSPEQAEQRLGAVSIKSFGTALMGWPKGPHYERFTNTADPVPAAITGAQTSYPSATWEDSAPAEGNYVFTDHHFDPRKSHSMDNTYLPAYAQMKGVHCACKGT